MPVANWHVVELQESNADLLQGTMQGPCGLVKFAKFEHAFISTFKLLLSAPASDILEYKWCGLLLFVGHQQHMRSVVCLLQ
jgi:hypothetical protein